jgi:2-dehydro-3-deoxy-D-arabinonate dehydratase
MSAASLVEWLRRDNSFPTGCSLSTGTGTFTLQADDEIHITIGPTGPLSNVVC